MDSGFGFQLTRRTNVKTSSEQGGYANRQYAVTEFYYSGSVRQFLTRLVQNLTLCKDCDLIPSAHGTQHLSSQSDHWTKGSLHWSFLLNGSFQRGEVRVEDAQLSLPVVAGT